MTDDIQLIDVRTGSEPPREEDRATPPADAAARAGSRPDSNGPGVGARTALLLLALFGLGLLGVGMLGASAFQLGLLGVFGGLRGRLLGATDGPGDPDADAPAAGDAGGPSGQADGRPAESDAESTAGDVQPGDGPAPIPREQPRISIAKRAGERDVAVLVDELLRAAERRPLPDASGIIAPIRRPLAATLEGLPQELDVLRRDVGPALVGVAYNDTTAERLAATYDLTLIVAPHHEETLGDVLEYLPALVRTDEVRGLGSFRSFTVSAPAPPGPEPESQATLDDLRGHKGEPRHPMARTEPDFIAVSAPSAWTGTVREVLSDYAPVLDVIERDDPEIHVAGFVFESAIDLPAHVVAPAEDRSSPAGDDRPPSSGGSDRDGASGGGSPRSSSGGTEPPTEPTSDGGTTEPTSDGGNRGGRDPPPSGRAPTTRPEHEPERSGAGSVPEGERHPRQSSEDDGQGSSSPDSEASGTSPGNGGGDGSDGSNRSPDRGSDARDATDEEGAGPDAERSPPTSGEGQDDATDGPSGSEGGEDADGPSPESGSDRTTGRPANGADPSPGSTGPGSRSGAPSDESAPEPASPGTDPDSILPAGSGGFDFGSDDGFGPPSGNGTGGHAGAAGRPGDADESDPGEGSNPAGDPATGSGAGARPGRSPPSGTGQPTASPGQDTPGGTSTRPAGTSGTPDGDTAAGPAPSGTRGGSSPAPPSSTDGIPVAPDPGPGIVPFGDAPASSDPAVVDVTQHVLNELTFQATATPDREVYSTVYADESGLIRHHHTIDHPDFVEVRKRSITFTSEFFDHLRRLANIHRDIDHRLAGDAHSHPISGEPEQSPADRRFARKVWRNQRNTVFIVGVGRRSGPDGWTITDDGYEVRRQSNDYLVRIRAFSGENAPKQIRLHQDMGR
ncbi:MAG: hypothetical protein V5A61_05690 [Haloarculaceae archaeon]